MARRFRTGSAGNYGRKTSPNLQRPCSGGVGFDTLHAQQRQREAAGLPAVKPCPMCRGLAMHYEGCPETWNVSQAGVGEGAAK